jgi:hypothetical protein
MELDNWNQIFGRRVYCIFGKYVVRRKTGLKWFVIRFGAGEIRYSSSLINEFVSLCLYFETQNVLILTIQWCKYCHKNFDQHI